MVSKIIKSRAEVQDKIVNALRLISEPVIQTLSPLGRNVIYETPSGVNQTNDGVTIAKQISSDDPIEQLVIEAVRQAALSTNRDAGDGTTTSTLLTKVLALGALKLVSEGINPMLLAKEFTDFGEKLISKLKPITIETDEQLHNIAKISSNGDEEIATQVVDVVKTAGQDGLVFIEQSPKPQTEILKDTGFIVEGGLFSPEYAQNQSMISTFEDCHVLVCDKRIYYEEEAQTILGTAIEAGIKELVIVARDFIGKSVNVFSANHKKNEFIKLILVKDPNARDGQQTLEDLAVYLGGTLITEKTGKLVDNLTAEDFCKAKKVYSNPGRTVISTALPDNDLLKERIKSLKEEKEKDDTNETINKRLASLTNGMVTVKVGGNTQIEVQEKIFRFEDAINATRSAMKFGYLPGGGLALLGAFAPEMYKQELVPLFKSYCEAPIRQIAKNCGQHEDGVLKNCIPSLYVGYNAKTGTHEDLLVAGVIDPYKVLELAIRNSISVTNVIATTEYYIAVNKDKDKDND